MASNTTVVFVPGAWHSPQCYDAVKKLLEDADYRTDYVHLASVGPPEQTQEFAADVVEVQKTIEKAADAGQEVVLVVHSYSGVVGSQAVEHLDLASRAKAGRKGGVRHIFFCCAFVISEGQTLLGALGGKDAPWSIVSDDKVVVDVDDPAKVFYNDLSQEQADEAIAMLQRHKYQTFHSPITYAGWKHVPSTYLYCTRDQALPIHVQKMMVEEGAKGFGMKTESLDASHSPFLSKPEETARAIRRAAGEAL